LKHLAPKRLASASGLAHPTYKEGCESSLLPPPWHLLESPSLGRPKSNPELLGEDKRQVLDNQRQRNAVEGKIGQGKRRFGLGLIRAKLAVTQG